MIKNIEINKEQIEKLSKRSNLRLKKDKSKNLIFKTVNIIFWILPTIPALFIVNKLSPQLFADNYNIYSNRKLIISEEEKNNIIKNFEKKYNKNIKIDQEDSVLLFDAIYKNNNLSDEEKKYFYSLIDIVEDNPYINKEKAYRNLINLDIDKKKLEENIEGGWNPFLFQIVITEEMDKSLKQHALIHEMIHALFEYSDLKEIVTFKQTDKPKFIVEGMCELLEIEYNEKKAYHSPNHEYSVYINMVKMLCETVGSDTVLKAYSTGNMDCIYTEMSKIKGSYDDAKKLITGIDDLTKNMYKKELTSDDKKVLEHKLVELRSYYNLKTYNIESKYINPEEDFFDNNYSKLLQSIKKSNYSIPGAHKVYFNSYYKANQKPYIGETIKDNEEGKSK